MAIYIIIVDRSHGFGHELSTALSSEDVRTHVVGSYGPALILMRLTAIAAVFLKFDTDPQTQFFRNKASELKVPLVFTDGSFPHNKGKAFSAQELISELTI
jgi:hypothetical protein